MMSTMYVRVKRDGFVYEFNETLARSPECEVVPEEVAYPERFISPSVAARIAGASRGSGKVASRKKGAALDLSTADIPEPPVYTSLELAAEASRGLPK